jgi:D-arabinitol 2-dehydrogenase
MNAHFKQSNPDNNNTRPCPKITAHYVDVSDPGSVDACLAEVLEAHGGKTINGLVTSAGFVENFAAVDYPPDRMRKLWGVNVDGTYLFATAVARHLVRFLFVFGYFCLFPASWGVC